METLAGRDLVQLVYVRSQEKLDRSSVTVQ